MDKKRADVVFLFQGQGAQKRNICADFLNTLYAQNLDASAKEVLGYSILDVVRGESDEDLRKTTVAQPVMFFLGYLSYIMMIENFPLRIVAAGGHSLGEITALAAAKVFSFTEGLWIVSQRARFMESACKKHLGGMLAVIGESPEKLSSIASEEGVFAANFNSSNQVVYAGELKRLEKFREKILPLGYKSVFLSVEGAFHTPYMEEAANSFSSFIKRLSFGNPIFPVVSNVTGKFHTFDRLKDLLGLQISSPVRWTECMKTLMTKNPDLWVESCPGKILIKFLPEEAKGEKISLTGRESIEECRKLFKERSGLNG